MATTTYDSIPAAFAWSDTGVEWVRIAGAYMKVLGLIPARGGSKGIPRKNIRQMAGKPLIAWTIEAALASNRLARVAVSTDDEEIAACAKAFGADVPFIRPAGLATDITSGIAPVHHALETLTGYDAVMLLQPTSPLRNGEDIAGILDAAIAAGAPSAVSVTLVDQHPALLYTRMDDARLDPFLPQAEPLRRQDFPELYALNGALYFAHSDWVGKRSGFVGTETIGYPMPAERSIDIDTMLDWRIAEMLLRDRGSAA